MAIIEPVNKDIQHSEKVKTYSSPLRLWHWATVIIVSGSLLTILINSTILDGRAIVALIKTTLQKTNTNITTNQAKSIVGEIRDRVWYVHMYLGFGLSSLLLFRLVLEFFQKADQKFIRKLKSAYNHYKITKRNRELARHELVVKSIYLLFYALLTITVITGLIMAFDDELIPLKPFRHKIQHIHSLSMYFIIGFIVVHITGVFLAERKNSKGIVSDMINGGGVQK